MLALRDGGGSLTVRTWRAADRVFLFKYAPGYARTAALSRWANADDTLVDAVLSITAEDAGDAEGRKVQPGQINRSLGPVGRTADEVLVDAVASITAEDAQERRETQRPARANQSLAWPRGVNRRRRSG